MYGVADIETKLLSLYVDLHISMCEATYYKDIC